ncbi:MAG: hypothetical protein Q7J85_09135 [Bacillota bacterium]|nr:hypothetical protein [Bacillota bacterium]
MKIDSLGLPERIKQALMAALSGGELMLINSITTVDVVKISGSLGKQGWSLYQPQQPEQPAVAELNTALDGLKILNDKLIEFNKIVDELQDYL